MKHIGLFEGIGGFSLAARWMGWETIAWCEWNEFCKQVLKHHFPKAKGHGDITQTDFTIYRGQCDLLTGGFPCQPFSNAGKRKGKEDNRFLWPEMLRAIREVQPTWVVAENVYGIINQGGGVVFQQVQTEMENEGYQVQSYILPACSVNAPHKRERVWFIAYSDKNRKMVQGRNRNSNNKKRNGKEEIQEWENKFFGLNQSSNEATTNPQRIRQQGQGRPERQIGSKEAGNWEASWTNADGGWPTQSPIRGRNDGLSTKLAKECLEALGNAIVPQVAFEIFKAIFKSNQLKST